MYPHIAGNFDTFVGVPNFWNTTEERNYAFAKGVTLMVVISLFTFLLMVSVVRTIRTSPGNIPEEKEWDM